VPRRVAPRRRGGGGSRERAAEFWERLFELTHEFMQIPRFGDTVYGFVAGLYPTEFPTLPDRDDDPG
jgi:hypothetical protein